MEKDEITTCQNLKSMLQSEGWKCVNSFLNLRLETITMANTNLRLENPNEIAVKAAYNMGRIHQIRDVFNYIKTNIELGEQKMEAKCLKK